MIRYDNVPLKAVKTDEGFILDKPVIGRVGLMKYLNADGSIRVEYRPPEEAFKADSLASIRGKPITLGHVQNANADNAGNIPILGTVLGNGEQDGENIRADVSIFRLPTDSRELSCGYSLKLDETPGVYQGQHYDAIQRNIKYNHLAIVPKGRAGVARLNMDGDQMYEDDANFPMMDKMQATKSKEKATQMLKNGKMTQEEHDKVVTMADKILNRKDEGEKMDKIRLDSGIEYECAPEVKIVVEQMRKDAAVQKKNQETLQAKYDSAEATTKQLKEDATKKETEFKANFDEAVKSRVEILETAKQHNIDKADEMQDKDIKIAIIKKVRGDSFNIDGKSEDYITAAFDMCKGEVKQNQDSAKKNRQAMHDNKDQDKNIDEDDLDAIEAKIREDEANAYKGGNK
jgi:hypothetical protein